MRRPTWWRVGAAVGAISMAVALLVACSSMSKGNEDTSAGAATRSVFCSRSQQLENIIYLQPSQILPALKANQPFLTFMSSHVPPGDTGREVAHLLALAHQAIAQNNPNLFQSVFSTGYGGPDIDTYCGQDGYGNPLPSDFGKGRGTAFCKTDSVISSGAFSTPTSADELAFYVGHPSEIAAYAAGVPSLPTAGLVQFEAQEWLSTVWAAIQANDPTKLEGTPFGDDRNSVDLYCGINH